jgi:arsenite methyltransferase
MSAVSLALDTPELASRYERVSADRQFKTGQELVSELQIKAGEKVLDIGSGTGLLAEFVASLVGPEGFVAGIDPLPLRIELAKQKTQANLRFEVGNANDLSQFAAETFDAVYLNAVFHWLPEKLGPLRQIYRVLKAGGRLAISTGSKDRPNQVQEIKVRVLSREPLNLYPVAIGGVAYRVNAVELNDLFRAAGFTVKKIDLVPNVHHHLTPDAAIDFFEASSFGNFLGHLPPGLRALARSEIKHELEQASSPEGFKRQDVRMIAIATKP